MQSLPNALATLSLATAATFMTGCATTDERQGTGAYFDDAVITTKVKAAIFNDSMLEAAEINVETFDRVVQLSGFVSSREAADRATVVVAEVAGVRSVRADMRVKQEAVTGDSP